MELHSLLYEKEDKFLVITGVRLIGTRMEVCITKQRVNFLRDDSPTNET